MSWTGCGPRRRSGGSRWRNALDVRRLPRRLAVCEGFSLHADTHVHATVRQGLERLCRHGSRGPLALEKLSLREDGRYAYRTRKGEMLVFTAAQRVNRLVALIPPAGVHLTRFHGVFAPNAKLRSRVVRTPAPPTPPEPALPKSTARASPSEPRPRLDWASLQRRTSQADV